MLEAYDSKYDATRTAYHGDEADAKDLEETIHQWIEPTQQWLGDASLEIST
jgi:hypothetical protein